MGTVIIILFCCAIGWIVGSLILRSSRAARGMSRCPHCQGRLPNTRHMPTVCVHCGRDLVVAGRPEVEEDDGLRYHPRKGLYRPANPQKEKPSFWKWWE